MVIAFQLSTENHHENQDSCFIARFPHLHRRFPSAGAHDGYQRAFSALRPKPTTIVGAAYGTPPATPGAATRPISALSAATTARLGQGRNSGVAAFGESTGPDGHAIYRAAFNGNG